MKFEFKTENGKTKSSYKDIYDLFKGMNSKFEADLSKADFEVIKKTYDIFCSNMVNCCREFNNAFENYMNMPDPKNTRENQYENPDIIPANGHDIYNYIARYGLANHQIQIVMKMDGRLDFEKLKKAVRLSVDVEPVLGSRFVEKDPPYWKRLDDLDNTTFCSLEKSSEPDKAVMAFLESPIDMDNDPMVKLKLIRSETEDILVIKINHSCCDGTGAKEYIELISNIYSTLAKGDNYIPVPRKRDRRDQDSLFGGLGIKNPDSVWIPGSDISVPTWQFPWLPGNSSNTHYSIVKMDTEEFKKMKEYGKANGATINDLIVTALYRAMNTMGLPVYGFPMEVPITVDLRRFIPNQKACAIRNFSGSSTVRLPMIPKESFKGTLSRVVSMMKDFKNSNPGLQSAIGLERLEKISMRETLSYFYPAMKVVETAVQAPFYCGDKCTPVLSNLGLMSKSPYKFGDVEISDISVIPPVVRQPGLLLVMSTYNDILTMSIGFFEGAVCQKEIDKLLNRIKHELTGSLKT